MTSFQSIDLNSCYRAQVFSGNRGQVIKYATRPLHTKQTTFLSMNIALLLITNIIKHIYRVKAVNNILTMSY